MKIYIKRTSAEESEKRYRMTMSINWADIKINIGIVEMNCIWWMIQISHASSLITSYKKSIIHKKPFPFINNIVKKRAKFVSRHGSSDIVLFERTKKNNESRILFKKQSLGIIMLKANWASRQKNANNYHWLTWSN